MPILETLLVAYNELEYIKAIAATTEKINEAVLRKELDVFENINTLRLMAEINNDEVQRAVMSLCRRVCDAKDIKFENIVQKVKMLYLEEDEFPEAKGLIEVIKLSSLDATTVVSYILADDFRSHPTMSILPTEQADYLTEKVSYLMNGLFSQDQGFITSNKK